MTQRSLNFMAPETQDGLLPFKLDAEEPGVYYSAIQNWTMCFLTQKGTNSLDPNYGTLFIPNLRSGKLLTSTDVARVFSEANAACLTYCENPDNVYVSNAWLTNIVVDEVDSQRFVTLYTAFSFSDGTSTRTYIEVA